MKQAVGELNATIAVVMLIGIMAVFFFTVLWPSINNTMVKNSKCSDAMCDANSVGADG